LAPRKPRASKAASKQAATEKAVPKSGTVTTFNKKRGVGYISSGGDDYVVRSEDIDMPGWAALESGQFVEFEATSGTSSGDDEVSAEKVRPVSDTESEAERASSEGD
jgi:cold shock CspA family protein